MLSCLSVVFVFLNNEKKTQTVIRALWHIVRCSASIWAGVTDSYSDKSSQGLTSISIRKKHAGQKRRAEIITDTPPGNDAHCSDMPLDL